jgi:putative transposase
MVGVEEREHAARRAKAQAVALFRYTLIREAADASVGPRQRGQMVAAIVAATHRGPFGEPVRVSRASIDRWIRAWRGGGFEALIPPARQVAPRTETAVLEMAIALKRENPARTAAQVVRILRQSTGSAPSERTLQRHFLRRELASGGLGGATPAVFGRFEADRPNELWVGDALHGPHVAGRKTYLFAFLDDHSRVFVGHRFGYAEDAVRLAAALRPALAARGIPDAVYVDNGSAFVDSWLLRACAVMGIRLVHSTPGRPQGRGKIERAFRTVREQFLVEITGQDATDGDEAGGRHYIGGLDELNRLFTAWVEQVYHRRVHTETGQTPIERFTAGAPTRFAGPGLLREAFLWSERRKVTKTATVSLHANIYQVDPLLAGAHVDLLFDPFDMLSIEVRHDGLPAGTAVPFQVTRHAHPKARPEIPQPPAAATGIDYAAVLDAAHDATLAGTVLSYADIDTTHIPAAARQPSADGDAGQLPGQLPIDGVHADPESS